MWNFFQRLLPGHGSWTGHSGVYKDQAKVEFVLGELERIGSTEVEAAHDEAKAAIAEVNKTLANTGYSLPEDALTEVYTWVQDRIKEIYDQVEYKAGMVDEYSESLSNPASYLATAGMLAGKFVEGFLGAGEQITDGFASALGMAVGIFDEDAKNAIGEYVAKDHVGDFMQSVYDSTGITEHSLITSDSLFSNVAKVVGGSYGYGTALRAAGALWGGMTQAAEAGATVLENMSAGADTAMRSINAATALAGVGGIGSGTQVGLQSGMDYNDAFVNGLKIGAIQAGTVFLAAHATRAWQNRHRSGEGSGEPTGEPNGEGTGDGPDTPGDGPDAPGEGNGTSPGDGPDVPGEGNGTPPGDGPDVPGEGNGTPPGDGPDIPGEGNGTPPGDGPDIPGEGNGTPPGDGPDIPGEGAPTGEGTPKGESQAASDTSTSGEAKPVRADSRYTDPDFVSKEMDDVIAKYNRGEISAETASRKMGEIKANAESAAGSNPDALKNMGLKGKWVNGMQKVHTDVAGKTTSSANGDAGANTPKAQAAADTTAAPEASPNTPQDASQTMKGSGTQARAVSPEEAPGTIGPDHQLPPASTEGTVTETGSVKPIGPEEPLALPPGQEEPLALPPGPEEPLALPPGTEEPLALPPGPEEPLALPPGPEEPLALPPGPEEPLALPPGPEEPLALPPGTEEPPLPPPDPPLPPDPVAAVETGDVIPPIVNPPVKIIPVNPTVTPVPEVAPPVTITPPEPEPIPPTPDPIPDPIPDPEPIPPTPDPTPNPTPNPEPIPPTPNPTPNPTPITSAPTTVPITTAPTTVPITSAPTTVPITSAPTTVPITSAPTTVPITTAPTTPQIVSEYAPIPNTGIDSKPTNSFGDYVEPLAIGAAVGISAGLAGLKKKDVEEDNEERKEEE